MSSTTTDQPCPQKAMSAPEPEPPPPPPEMPSSSDAPPDPNKTPDASQFPKPPRPSFKPVCTHLTMDRVYDATCHFCGRKSPLGWVYACTQDEGDDPWAMLAKLPDLAPDQPPSDPINIMTALGFHKSVIEQAKNGLYTREQLNRLLAQKKNAIDAINDQSPDKAVQELCANGQSLNATVIAKERARRLRTVRPRCRYKCCHTCRADFKARSFESFDAILSGEVKPLRPAEMANLRVHDYRLVSNLGMKFPPLMTRSSFSTESDDSEPSESTDTWKTTGSAVDFRNHENAQARTFYKVQPMSEMDYMYSDCDDLSSSIGKTIRTGVSNAVRTFFRKRRESSSDGSAVTLPVARSVKKSLSRSYLQDSGLSLPKSFFSRRNTSALTVAPSTVPQGEFSPEEVVPKFPFDATALADDDDVDGGVLLTEESVELHKPDLVSTQNIVTQA